MFWTVVGKTDRSRVSGSLVLAIAALFAGAVSARESVAEEPGQPEIGFEIAGSWVFDTSYVRDYLLAGRRLQQEWCGYGWSDTELEERILIARRTGSFPMLSLRKVGDQTYEKTTLPEYGTPETTPLLRCTVATDSRMRCDTASHKFAEAGYPDLDAMYFRREGRYLLIDMPVHKAMMQCPKGKEPPDEVKWTSLRYQRPQ